MDSWAVTRADRPRVAVYPPGTVLSRRPIEDHELLWMLHGTATLRVPGEDLPVPPGMLLLLPPGLPHTLLWDRTTTSAHGYVHFDLARTPGPPAPRLHPMGAGDPAVGLCRLLLDVGRRPAAVRAGDGSGVLVATVRVLLDVVLVPPGDTAGPVPAAVTRAVGYLRWAWADMPLRRVPVGELAAAAALSPSQLTRVFSGWFGAGPAEVLEQARLDRAEQLLLRTDLTVDAVAHACGFADAAHLTHRFRAVHGIPPGRFRTGAAGAAPAARSRRLVDLLDALWS
jgi:AraC-like DNA-binding protein